MRLWAFFLLSFPLFAADVAIAPQSLTFAWQWNSRLLPPEQGILLTSPEPFTFTVTRPAGDGWLSIRPDNNSNTLTGTGPTYIPININPGAIGPDTYNSSITIKLSQGSVTIPVRFQVSATPVLVTDRGILGFDPQSPLLIVSGALSNGGNANISATTQTPWLNVQSRIGGSFFVSADSVRAGAGLSAGNVQLTVFGVQLPANNPMILPAVHMGTGLGSRAPLTASPAAVSFTGSGTQQVTVTGGPFTATSDASWAAVSVSGQTLTVTANTAGLEPRNYTATVILNSNGVLQMLPVSLALAAPSLAKVVNAASYAEDGIAPGEVVALFGSNIGPNTLTGLALDANGFVSSTLAQAQVTFNGVAAPLVYVSANQVAAVVPYDLDGAATAAVQVTVGGRQSNTVTVPVVAAAPGIFTADASGTGPAASFRTGDVVTLYVTGEGQTNPAGVNGKVTSNPPVPRLSVAATIDGQRAEVLFARSAPGIVSGVMQVNLQAAPGVRSGPVPVVVTVGGAATQTGVTVSIR